jgi:uncharacterized membrane protein YtjA (UPF0391 family)
VDLRVRRFDAPDRPTARASSDCDALLVIALIAAVMGFTGIAGMSMNIAWVLFVVGMIFAIALFFMGRRRRVS